VGADFVLAVESGLAVGRGFGGAAGRSGEADVSIGPLRNMKVIIYFFINTDSDSALTGFSTLFTQISNCSSVERSRFICIKRYTGKINFSDYRNFHLDAS
jgi:hypothetical protein